MKPTARRQGGAARNSQQGNTLLLILVFLAVLTILGLTAMQDTTLQERMAGNLRERSLAFQAAESALRETEQALAAAATEAEVATLLGGALRPRGAAINYFGNLGEAWARPAIASGTIDAAGRVVVERLGVIDVNDCIEVGGSSVAGGCPPIELLMYRIVARGSVGTDSSVVVLESFYGRFPFADTAAP
ncbi:MAG: PilX N-terminal domain-containing pilus assembly protein [Pseudomonadota bacterium]|nr:PilX N-terminal domain-containing pilus assembly protein [Pseudomonadota bacterium]